MAMTVAFADTLLDTGVQRSYQIAETPYRFIVATPATAPELWTEFLSGAHIAYSRHGIENALDGMEDGCGTTLFLAAVDHEGTVVGGVRAQGPYASIDEAHAPLEWAGHPGENTLRKQISDRLPFGVVEMKTAWVGNKGVEGHAVANAIARSAYPVSTLLGAKFVLATAADYSIRRWGSSGGRIATEIPAAPYPTPDIRAMVMWWDRETMLGRADARLVPSMLRETDELMSIMVQPDRSRLVSAG